MVAEPEALEARLREAMRLRLIAEAPFGALLSGSRESSLIVALTAAPGAARPRTSSVGFCNQHCNELPAARIVAERFKTDHRAKVIDDRVEDRLPVIVRRHGDPCADPGAGESLGGRVVQQVRRQLFQGGLDHRSRIWSGLMCGLWHRYAAPGSGRLRVGS